MELLGVGAASQIYKVDDHIVLKARRRFERPSALVSPLDQWLYASESLSHFNQLKDQQSVVRLLEQHPHSNFVQAIDTGYNEGIYLRRYHTLAERGVSSQEERILWYQDIVGALMHLHELNVAHADLR